MTDDLTARAEHMTNALTHLGAAIVSMRKAAEYGTNYEQVEISSGLIMLLEGMDERPGLRDLTRAAIAAAKETAPAPDIFHDPSAGDHPSQDPEA